MAPQSDPEKLTRLNWRERWHGWCRRLRPETGSEPADKPVPAETGLNSEPVLAQQTGLSETGFRTQSVYDQNLRLFLESITPSHHARHLLEWLQAQGCSGQFVVSVDIRDNAYPQFCAERGWEPLPWHGPEGVGKHFAELCGGRPIKPFEGKPTRCYAIPAAVVELATERRQA